MIAEQCSFSPTDLAWAAGFVDGEGYLTVTKKHACWRKPRPASYKGRPRLEGTTYYLNITVTNRNPTTIERLVDLFGGRRHETVRVKGNKNNYYRWRLGSDEAFNAITLILPFLVGKRELAEVCISFHQWYRATAVKSGQNMPPERRAQAEFYHQTCRALIRRYRSAPERADAPGLAAVVGIDSIGREGGDSPHLGSARSKDN